MNVYIPVVDFDPQQYVCSDVIGEPLELTEQQWKEFYDQKDLIEIKDYPHLNPFYGGSIQRHAHANGSYDDVNYRELALKGWKNRNRKEASDKMHEGLTRWKKNNPEQFSLLQKSKARKAKKSRQTIFLVNGRIYKGWKELERIGITKYKFMKHQLGIKLKYPKGNT